MRSKSVGGKEVAQIFYMHMYLNYNYSLLIFLNFHDYLYYKLNT